MFSYRGLPEPPSAQDRMLPEGTFADNVVAVTGGGTGIGKAVALAFGRLGAKVAVLSRGEDHRRAGVEALTDIGVTATDAAVDVRDERAIAAAFDKVEDDLGAPIDILVNNAAANFPVAAADLSPNGWRAVVDIVLNGTFLCSRELVSRLLPGGRPGVILNVLATQVFTGGPAMAHSAAAKAGVHNLTKTLAVEWGPEGIRVNSIAPGVFVHEDMRPEFTALADDSWDGRGPAYRPGRLHELGWAATFVCSPYATYLNGHTMVLDGGSHHRRDFTHTAFVPVSEQLRSLSDD